MNINRVKTSNRFWRSNGNNRVTTRQRGDIPGILGAKDVFISVSQEQMRAVTTVRTNTFCQMIRDWQNGVIGFREFTNDPFHRGDVVLNVIKNPSTPYQRAYD